MKVLEVFGEPINRGGQQSFVMYALQNMDLSKVNVDLFSPYFADNDDLINLVKANGGKVFAADLPYMPGKSRRNIIPALKQYLQENHYDIVHIHSGSITALAYCAKVASQAGTKRVIVHSHSPGPKDNLKHRLIRAYAAPLLKKHATDFCACSLPAARWKFPESVLPKVKIINNGVDIDRFAYDETTRKIKREQYNIDDNTLVLGNVGRFTYEKNQIFLIDMLKAYLEKHHNEKVKLVLLGEGDDKTKVIEKVKEYNLDDIVIFPTEYNKARDYLQMFDIFVFPSLYEGVPIVGLEALTAALPVVASLGVPRLLKITDTVTFVSLDDIDGWCKAIDSFRNIERKSQRDVIIQNGFDVRDTGRAVQELYETP